MENGKLVKTGKRAPVDLDKYPPFTPGTAYGSIEISRGCPYHCTYCQTPRIFGHDMRHRSIDTIAKYASYFNDVRFTTPNAFAYGSDGRHLEIGKLGKLLRALKKKSRRVFFGTFPSEVRPGFITHEALELVTCYCANKAISMGAQSGSSRVLGEICRGHSVDDIVCGVEMCLEHGLEPVVDFIIGLPCESEQDQLASLELIEWICAKGGKVRAHAFVPLPGTPLENHKPARIAPGVDRLLGKLALHGKLEGSWRVY